MPSGPRPVTTLFDHLAQAEHRAKRNGPRNCPFAMRPKEAYFDGAAMKLRVRALLALVLSAACGFVPGSPAFAQTDPLALWNGGAAKTAIVEFVHATTDQASPKFVAPEE